MRKIVLSFLCILVVQQAIAKNYYVSVIHGSRQNNGLSPKKPKKILDDAAKLTKPGDTVFVMNGVYKNDCSACNVLTITKSGKRDRYITFTNMKGHKPIISFNGWAGIFIKAGVNFINIHGFEIIGNNLKVTIDSASRQPGSCQNKKGQLDPRFNGNGLVVESKNGKISHHIIISSNRVHDCGGAGIGISHADYVTVEDNLVYNNCWYSLFGTSGISFYQFGNTDNDQGYHNFIRRNKCFNNNTFVPWQKNCEISDGNGIIIDDFQNRQNGSKLKIYNSRTLIENNICWYNGGTGIHAFQSDHVDIINNTAFCNSQSAGLKAGQILTGLGTDNKIVNNILVSDKEVPLNSNFNNRDLTYENNLHFNISNPSTPIINVSSPSCIYADPLFTSPVRNLNADFKVRANSPAINRSSDVVKSTSDYEGKKRSAQFGTIGAYEY